MGNYDKYTYKTIWSEEDQEFVGLCEEFPSLSYLNPDRHQAYEGIVNLAKDVILDLKSTDEPIPKPHYLDRLHQLTS
ncbi:hypothetical protein [Gloeocapsa sp. PCC 73106]|uniref:hypothetical protein n=1 Tax=Gloeocapsa sp. PCC 73106 TaxID=102232 RepID=UPI0002ACD11E|nr:hypothetical protein [Gloeocapsa sp. PCC 73106]ELR98932.1 hypothetical protein GLO73106DRAFT_00027740 [Gloeocapsa sp. PCC 73106]